MASGGQRRAVARRRVHQSAYAVPAFDASRFTDEHRKRVAAAIKKKVAGREIASSDLVADERDTNVIDLMQALRRSVHAGAGKSGNEPKARRRRRAA